MSIDYQSHGDAMELANQMQEENNLDYPIIEGDYVETDLVDTDTGEIVGDDDGSATQS
jgi:hypothetical protein